MRRVSSSLGMRRSSSFFWTPSAHLDFEKAVEMLTARGSTVTASAIQTLMRNHHDLKAGDIDKHMQKKKLVQRRLMQQLTPSATVARLEPEDAPARLGSPRNSIAAQRHMDAVEEEQEPTLLIPAAQFPL